MFFSWKTLFVSGVTIVSSTTLAGITSSIVAATSKLDNCISCNPFGRLGIYTVKVLPSPTLLSNVIQPPNNLANSLQIDKPNPVPPYFRIVLHLPVERLRK